MRACILDTESDGLLREATRLWCAVTKDIQTGQLKKYRPHEIELFLKDLGEIDVLIGHNLIQHDLALLRKLHGYEYKGKSVDTLWMSRQQNPKRQVTPGFTDGRIGPHSVEAWGYRLGRSKPAHEDWTQFSEDMLHRCSEDVEIQHLIYKALMEEAKPYNWMPAHRLTFKLFDILQRQEEYGWLVDQPYMHKCVHQLTHWMDRIDRAIAPHLPLICVPAESKKKGEYNYVRKPFLKSGQPSQSVICWLDDAGIDVERSPIVGPYSRISFRRVDLNSNDETKEWLLHEGWEPEQWNTNDSGERTSPKLSHTDSFAGITSGRGRIIARRVQCRHRRSQINGWFDNIRSDGRIGARVSGLADTARAKHAVIVNVPGEEAFFGKQMRKCFICKPGYKIVGTDSAGCQNRMLAARVGDDKFTEILINGDKSRGTSIHQVNQQAIRNIAGIDVEYRTAKNLNYAFMFGASDAKLGRMVGKSSADGACIREALLSISPGFQTLVESLTKEWRSHARVRQGKWGKPQYYDGWVVGLDGRPIFIPKESDVLVYVLQSDEAIMMSAAYCMLYKIALNRDWLWGSDWAYVIWAHDEVQCEVRQDISEEFAQLAEQCIVDAGKYFKIACPHKGDSKIGDNWYSTH